MLTQILLPQDYHQQRLTLSIKAEGDSLSVAITPDIFLLELLQAVQP